MHSQYFRKHMEMEMRDMLKKIDKLPPDTTLLVRDTRKDVMRSYLVGDGFPTKHEFKVVDCVGFEIEGNDVVILKEEYVDWGCAVKEFKGCVVIEQ